MLLRKEGKLWTDGAEVENFIRAPESFLKFHDGYVDELVDRHASDGTKSPTLARLCAALRDRRPPELLLEISALTPRGGEHGNVRLIKFTERRKERLPKLAETLGIPLECWLFEDPRDITFERLGPLMSLTEADTVTAREEEELVRLIDRDGTTRLLVESPDNIVHHLAGLRFQAARLYLVEDNEARVAKAKDEVLAWLGE